MKASAPGRSARLLALAGLFAASLSAAAAAGPLALADEAGLDRFAELVTAYRDASRVRWVVRADTPEERARILSAMADRLGPGGIDLLERISALGPVASTRSVAPADGAARTDRGPTAHIAVAPPPNRTCSWRVTVDDPAAPTPPGGGLRIPIERGDVIPTSPEATFEVGFAGPLQSALYAFAETAPGAVRDLAAAPDVEIPVEPSAEETLVLVRARRPVPFLDGIRTALGQADGARADLGRNAALAERFRNAGRGIGANIQLVDPGMIVARADPRPAARPAGAEPETDRETPVASAGSAGGTVADGSAEGPLSRADDLVETCLYTVTRLPG